MTKFSIIIPTMWIPNLFVDAIKEYLKSNFVDEIIIIDNNPENKLELPKDNRIKIFSKGYNIFVNPAWNWGVELSTNDNLVFVNDDVILYDIDELLELILKGNYSIVGAEIQDLDKCHELTIFETTEPMKRGFGCFFYINKKNYLIIPEDLKIFYGDLILFNSVNTRHIFRTNKFKFELSKTIKNKTEFISLIENSDKPIFQNKYKNNYHFK